MYEKSKVKYEREKHNGKIFNLASDTQDMVFGTEAKCDYKVQVEPDASPIAVLEEFNSWGPLFKRK